MSKRKGFKAAVGSALNDEAASQPSPAIESWLSPTTESRVDQVPVGEISDPDWRRALDTQDPAYRALKASVRASGILQPVLLRPLNGGGYQVVSGMRRVRAARDTFQDTVPATVRQLTEVEAIVGSLDALMRDPIAVEEREAIAQRLRDGGMPAAEAAALLGALRLGGVEAVVVEEAPAAAVVDEAPAAAVVDEAPAIEVVEEAPAAEVVEEAPAIEVVEEPPAAEVVEEAPTAEEVVEETPAAEMVEEAPAAAVVEEAPAAEVVEEAPAAAVVEEAPAAAVVEEAPAAAVVEETPAAEVVEEAPAAEDEEAAEAMVAEGAPDAAEVEGAPAVAEHPAVTEVADAIAAAFEAGPAAPVAPALSEDRDAESTTADIAAAFEAAPVAAAPPGTVSAPPAVPERPKARTERKPAPAEKDRAAKRTSRVISIDLPGPATSGAGAVAVAPPRSIAPALPPEPVPAARPAPPGNVAVRVVKDPRFWATVGTFIAVWATVFILVGVALGSGSARLLIIAAIIAAAGFTIAIVALAVPRRSP